MTLEDHDRRLTGLEEKVSSLDDRQQSVERAVVLNAETQRSMAQLLRRHAGKLDRQDGVLRGDGKRLGLVAEVATLEQSDRRRWGHIKWILGTLGTVITTLVGAAVSWFFGLHK